MRDSNLSELYCVTCIMYLILMTRRDHCSHAACVAKQSDAVIFWYFCLFCVLQKKGISPEFIKNYFDF